jgi:1,4-alpha-glucan branching enzyme
MAMEVSKSQDEKKKLKQTSRKWLDEAWSDPVLQTGVDHILAFEEKEPSEFLGPHLIEKEHCVVIRAYLPRASEAWVWRKGDKKTVTTSMARVRQEGIFEAVFENQNQLFSYEVGFIDATGVKVQAADPYGFDTHLSGADLQALGEGSHHSSYEKLGAHVMTIDGVAGVHFAVWAPNARSVSLVGNFNHWRPGTHPMNRISFSGFWALFVPGLKEGSLYKFAVKGCDQEIRIKTDPCGFRCELRPETASIVASLNNFKWSDDSWIKRRREWDYLRSPISIYEVHLGSWKREEKTGWGFMNYRDLAKELVMYVKEMGYTHVQLMPVAEHPLDQSWGYQVTSYFAPTSRFGKPDDFMYFVDYCHQHGIGVLLDWVPGHFPRDAHALGHFDGREIYGYESWKKREHKDWGTFVFDYGRSEVKNFLISNALFWLDKYHIDGLRVDAVASMLYLDYSRASGEWECNVFGGNENLEAIDFFKLFNEVVHNKHPGVLTIAEESTAWPGVSKPTYLGGLGFSLKWNMGWMNDSLSYFSQDPIYRKWHQGVLTFSLIYAFTENFVLPISHDEVVHGKRSLIEKMSGDDWQKFAGLRLFLTYMFTHPGKKLLFMGSDFGQRGEWNCDSSIDWNVLHYVGHEQTRTLTKNLNQLYSKEKALHELDFGSEGFEWIDFQDSEASVISFVRWSRDHAQCIVVVCNMTPTPRLGYRIGVPRPGFYRELLNSDASEFGGSGVGNCGGFAADDQYCHGKPYSLNLNLPPLGALIFRQEDLREQKMFKPENLKE